MHREERVVAALVERALNGARMRPVASQSNREWDFDLEVDGASYPFEVTRATNRVRHEQTNAILGREGDADLMPRKLAQYDWWVFTSHMANVKRIRRNVDRLLAEVEREGLTEFDINGIGANFPAVQALWQELRILHGTHMPWDPPGQIGIALPSDSAILSADSVTAAAEREAGKLDNRTKLGRSTAQQRHLCVFLDEFAYPADESMKRGLMPSSAPALPQEISHLWVVTYLGRDSNYLVWRFEEHSGWSSVGALSAASVENI